MIVDFHTHIFSAEIKDSRSYYSQLDSCFGLLYTDAKAKIATAEDLISNMDGEGIDVSVVLNVGWASQELCEKTNDYIIDAVSRYPDRLVGFCSVQPLAGEAAVNEVKRCIRGGIKGIGELRCDTQGFDLSNESVMSPILQLAMEHGLVILTHASEPVGHSYTGKGTITPDVLYRFIQNFPDVTLVCAHWGGGLPFYALMPEVAKALTNVYFDSAASPFLYRDDIFTHLVEIIGAGKILFGSDYPLISQSRIVRSIRALDLPDEMKNMMLGGNASRILAIP